MKTIYIVQGTTGEYSDHRDWIVKAFASEKTAQEFVLTCSAEAKRLEAKYPNYLDWKWPDLSAEDDEKPAEKHQYDPHYDRDYTGTNYLLDECELVED